MIFYFLKIKEQFYEVNLNKSHFTKKNSFLRAAEALEKVSIRDPERVLESYPFQLSGGLAQRVVITMAMINKPQLLLADEPSTALDVTIQNQALELMNDLTKETNTAVLLITHNMGVVRKFAEKVYVIYRGVIVEEGTKDQIFSNLCLLHFSIETFALSKCIKDLFVHVFNGTDFQLPLQAHFSLQRLFHST